MANNRDLCKTFGEEKIEVLLGAYIYTLERDQRIGGGGVYQKMNMQISKGEYQFMGAQALYIFMSFANIASEKKFVATSGIYYRGMNCLPNMELFKEGNELRFTAFTSTSQDREKARDFQKDKTTKKCKPESVMFQFIIPGGVPANAVFLEKFSDFPEEVEICFLPFSRFRVQSIEKLDPSKEEGQSIITLFHTGDDDFENSLKEQLIASAGEGIGIDGIIAFYKQYNIWPDFLNYFNLLGSEKPFRQMMGNMNIGRIGRF